MAEEGDGVSPNGILTGGKFPAMIRQRSLFRESTSWVDPSQVFTDTHKVDLFNDPPWELVSPTSARQAVDDETRRPRRWTTGTATAFRRILMKRGQHSRHLA